ncbi:MAG: sulfide/dihydroorotate dehydrogenase-like FAD/NAD-binding protein [Candidatus Omnitrophica bacterium]|nr:sulfide/dihydroorotate dehydrogenase-like FAD/NAD-binding protein [Candidatus Omnitrophota bacterium]
MKITHKTIIKESADTKIIKLVLQAPLIAQKAQAGQFVVLMASDHGERVPLTVVDTQPEKGEITLIFQELGFTTRTLGALKTGDSLFALTGPLGHPTEIKNFGKVILVGGGVGIAEILPVAKAFKKAGNHVVTILGARTKELLILEHELRSASDELFVATDDGSYGQKGFTTDVLARLLESDHYDLVYAVGPIPMMKRVSSVAAPHKVKTLVSLNALMVDATGMCGCCRVTIGGKTKFSCVDGPEFDGNLVDWNELEKRNRIYGDKEKHICNLSKIL